MQGNKQKKKYPHREWKVKQLKGELRLSRAQLEDRVDEYLSIAPEELYCGDIVGNDRQYLKTPSRAIGYVTTDKEEFTFCEVIAEKLCDSELNIVKNKTCSYSSGSRADKSKELSYLKDNMAEMEKYYANDKRKEPRMCQCFYVQEKIDEFEVVDYEVPTRNRGDNTSHTGKIDLVLKKGDIVYVTEVKYFKSIESLLRCMLEIQTYYGTLNEKFFIKYGCSKETLKKAILIDKESFAYSQLELPWAKKLLDKDKFDITVLILSKDNEAFHITEYNNSKAE